MDYSPPGSCPWNFPGKNTGVDCHFLLQGIFADLGIEPVPFASPALEDRSFTTVLPRSTYALINVQYLFSSRYLVCRLSLSYPSLRLLVCGSSELLED